LVEGISQLPSRSRDVTLKAVGEHRGAIPELDLTFNNPPARYDFKRDIVSFAGKSLRSQVQCAISREALDDYFGTDGLDAVERVNRFLENRSEIERMARAKYLLWPIEEPEEVVIKTGDIAALRKETFTTRLPRPKRSAKR
jgi:hypothetical protein